MMTSTGSVDNKVTFMSSVSETESIHDYKKASTLKSSDAVLPGKNNSQVTFKHKASAKKGSENEPENTTKPKLESKFPSGESLHDSSAGGSNCSDKPSNSESCLSKASEDKSNSSKECSTQLSKLSIPLRGQYHKLESTSLTEQLSQTLSNSSFKHEWHLNGSQIDTTSASYTPGNQSYSQLSSIASPTLTPTPLHALPHSSTDLSSSNQMVSPTSPSGSISSPPLSPITPLTNTITPEAPAAKVSSSKKTIQKAAMSSQYIFVAAHQISEAQEHEKRNEIIEAVAKYREGVGTLLKGVQGTGYLFS